MGNKVKDKKQEEKLYVDNRGESEVQRPTEDDPMVVCDFSEVSRTWSLGWSRIDVEAQQWNAVIRRDLRDDLTDEEVEIANNGKIEAMSRTHELFLERNKMMAQVLVSVPSDWLTKDAPADFDVNNPQHLLDYIKESHSQDLINGVILARAAASKN